MVVQTTEAGELFARQRGINVQRFWSNVDQGGGPDACWPWKLYRDNYNYGVAKAGGRTSLAHRVAFGLTTGQSPEQVCHRCDNPACCNPNHLFSGSAQANSDDKVAKGRQRSGRGEAHGCAKLNNREVIAVRERWAAGGVTQREIGEAFGVTQQVVSKVVNNKLWRHVGVEG